MHVRRDAARDLDERGVPTVREEMYAGLADRALHGFQRGKLLHLIQVPQEVAAYWRRNDPPVNGNKWKQSHIQLYEWKKIRQ